MKLLDGVHLVGSGSLGFGLTDDYDCHVYLLDGGDELALVDVGAGMGAEQIIENVRREGFDPGRIQHLLLTHAHGDHAGGAARMRRLLDDPAVYLSGAVASYLREADEVGISLGPAKAAGIYPADYRFEACEVDVELVNGSRIEVGSLSVEAIDTPGHADGHVSFLFEHAGSRVLLAGDVIFFGGKVLLQAIHDCRLDALIRSLRTLRDLEVTALLPGHLTVALRDGQSHIERANEILDRLLIPEQLVGVW